MYYKVSRLLRLNHYLGALLILQALIKLWRMRHFWLQGGSLNQVIFLQLINTRFYEIVIFRKLVFIDNLLVHLTCARHVPHSLCFPPMRVFAFISWLDEQQIFDSPPAWLDWHFSWYQKLLLGNLLLQGKVGCYTTQLTCFLQSHSCASLWLLWQMPYFCSCHIVIVIIATAAQPRQPQQLISSSSSFIGPCITSIINITITAIRISRPLNAFQVWQAASLSPGLLMVHVHVQKMRKWTAILIICDDGTVFFSLT